MTGKSTRVLLDQQMKKFADQYLILGKISAAARAAGYSPKSAHVTGNRLLKRPDVQAYLTAKATKQAESVDDLQTRVVKEMEALAFANIKDFIRIDENGRPQVDFSTATEDQLRSISSVASKQTTRIGKDGDVTEEVSSRFTMADKYRGLELLGRTMGMFKDTETRVVLDVADRLLHARQRLLSARDDGDAS